MSEERKRERFAMVTDNDEPRSSSASRARNRTVLLTPETVGQVRAQMTDEGSDPLNDLLPPVNSWEGEERETTPPAGFTRGSGGFERPAVEEVAAEDTRPQFEARGRGPAAARASGTFGFRPGAAYPTPGGPSRKAPTGSERRPAPVVAEEERSFRPVKAKPKSRIVGFLISFEADQNGEVFEIRQGRYILTSRPIEHGDYILVDDETISPMHAVVRATADGKVQILDQLSEHGTGVLRSGTEAEEEVMGSTVVVQHGDVLRFGKRKFVVCLIPTVVTETA